MIELNPIQNRLINEIDLFIIDLDIKRALYKAQKPPIDPYTEFLSQLTRHWNKQVQTAVNEVITTANQFMRTTKLNEKVIEAMTESFTDYLGTGLAEHPEIKTAVKNLITQSWQDGKEKAFAYTGLKPEWQLIDQRAVNHLMRDTTFWIGQNYGNNVGPKIAEITRKIGIESGLGRREVGKALYENFKDELLIPMGFRGSPLNYYTMVGAASTNRARAWGNVIGFRERGVAYYRWEGSLDERQCPICTELEGKEWKTEWSVDQIEKAIDSQDPEYIKNNMPWIGFDQGRASKHGWEPSKMTYPQGIPIRPQRGTEKGRAMGLYIKDSSGNKTYLAGKDGKLKGTKELADMGIVACPAHALCRCDVIESVDTTREEMIERKPAILPKTPSEEKSVMGKQINNFNELKEIIGNNKDYFIRWSRGPKYDLKMKNSKDYLTGEIHAGLSAVQIDPEWSTGYMARRSKEYGFLRSKDPKINAWVYKGEIIGTDSDGYPTIKIKKTIGSFNKKLVKKIDQGLADRLDLEEKLRKTIEMRQRASDKIGQKILDENIIKLKKQLDKMKEQK